MDEHDILDESVSDCSFLSEPDTNPQSINIDISNGSPIDAEDFIVVHFNIDDSILAEGRNEQLEYEAVSDQGPVWVRSEEKIPSGFESTPNIIFSMPRYSLVTQLSEEVWHVNSQN